MWLQSGSTKPFSIAASSHHKDRFHGLKFTAASIAELSQTNNEGLFPDAEESTT
jgi:hypothetical protein